MDRLLPASATEPAVPASAATGAFHTTAYTLLALMVLGGAWVRFNDQIAQAIPALAGPAAVVADTIADAHRIKGLVEVPIVPEADTREAIAAMALPATEAGALTEAVRKGRLRLARLPLLDLGANPTDQGRMVVINAAGYTRMVRLSRTPVVLTFPVGPMGAVSFQTDSVDGVVIGAVTLTGLNRLPNLGPGQTLDMGIVAQ